MAKGFPGLAAAGLTDQPPANAPVAPERAGPPTPAPRSSPIAPEVPPEDAVLAISGLPALRDGQPTVGGLLVAAPHLRSHRRVFIRNPETGQAVVAKLYWRDPGPDDTLLSSAAAKALGAAPSEAIALDAAILKGG